MGYFSNGSEVMDYEARYCDKCLHHGPPDGPGCMVWLAHLLNPSEGLTKDGEHNPESILNLLIPRAKDGLGNEQCRMYLEDPAWNQEELFPEVAP